MSTISKKGSVSVMNPSGTRKVRFANLDMDRVQVGEVVKEAVSRLGLPENVPWSGLVDQVDGVEGRQGLNASSTLSEAGISAENQEISLAPHNVAG